MQQIARLPLSIVERIDNAEVALGEKLHLDKTQMVREAMEDYLAKMEKLHNHGKPFPPPQPGQGLRRFAVEENGE